MIENALIKKGVKKEKLDEFRLLHPLTQRSLLVKIRNSSSLEEIKKHKEGIFLLKLLTSLKDIEDKSNPDYRPPLIINLSTNKTDKFESDYFLAKCRLSWMIGLYDPYFFDITKEHKSLNEIYDQSIKMGEDWNAGGIGEDEAKKKWRIY